jgi:hypothetical protein
VSTSSKNKGQKKISSFFFILFGFWVFCFFFFNGVHILFMQGQEKKKHKKKAPHGKKKQMLNSTRRRTASRRKPTDEVIVITDESDLDDFVLHRKRASSVFQDFLQMNPTQIECAICLDPMLQHQKVCVLPCCHMFHAKEIWTWLDFRPCCPICNINLMHFFV